MYDNATFGYFSHHSQNVGHIFEVFAEVARPEDPQDAAFVLQHYPEDLDDKVHHDYFCPPPWRSHWGGGGVIQMLGVRPCVRHKAC